MGKNKEEFMKDREQFRYSVDDRDWAIDVSLYNEQRGNELQGELEEAEHLLGKCKTLISDMVMYNLSKDMYNRYDDIMKQSQELLTELKDY